MSSSSEPLRTLDLAQAAALAETTDVEGAYPRFDQAQLDTLMANGERRSVQPGEVFWVAGTLAVDSDGYLMTGADAARALGNGSFEALGREPLILETSAPGVFAVGDVRSRSIKRVASAVGEGSMAIRLVHEHLATSSEGGFKERSQHPD
jgi:alkyl hydroperoxide reductase subunit AhpF